MIAQESVYAMGSSGYSTPLSMGINSANIYEIKPVRDINGIWIAPNKPYNYASINSMASIISDKSGTGLVNYYFAKTVTELISDFNSGLIQPIYSVTELGETKNLNFGINIIDISAIGDKEIRLPYPPVKGKSLTIINNSGYVVSVYPSVVGGSINGVVNGVAQIPSDGNPYLFTCWENPLPGAWTWTPPASGQYDSGIVTFDTTIETGVVSFIDAANYGEGVGFNVSSGWAYDIYSKPQIKAALSGSDYYVNYRPSPNWNAMTKLKVYSNIRSIEGANCQFLLKFAKRKNYYVSGSSTFKNADAGSTGEFFSYHTLDLAVPGTASGRLSTNIGDDGTAYAIVDLSTLVAPDETFVGAKNIGSIISGGVLCDNILTQVISFQFQTNFIDSGIKLQFFIEKN